MPLSTAQLNSSLRTVPHGAIEAIYAAGSGELTWQAGMQEVAAAVGAQYARIGVYTPVGIRGYWTAGNAPSDVQKVFTTWPEAARHQDPLRALLDTLPTLSVRRLSDILPGPALYDSGFYRDYAAHLDGADVLSFDLAKGPARFVNVSAWVDGRGSTFGDESAATFAALAPHMNRALRIEEVLARAQLRQNFGAATLEALSSPLLILDRNARVEYANTAAVEFFQSDHGLRVFNSKLEATQIQQTPLSSILKAVIERNEPIATIRVERTAFRPLLLTVITSSVGLDVLTSADATTAAILFIGDPDQEITHVEEFLTTTYGLTEKESSIVSDLANGLDSGMIAAKHGIKADTVLKHLKRIFDKTGTSRQAELVRLALLQFGRNRWNKDSAPSRSER